MTGLAAGADAGADAGASSEAGPRPTAPPRATSVICVGETLYDSLPDAIYLGGAPTNVAVHLCGLGVPAAVASCVGPDRLGDEAVRRLGLRGVGCGYVQRHGGGWGTGMVAAEVDPRTGDATYSFDTPAAWDGLELTEDLRELIAGDGDGDGDGDGCGGGVVAVIGTVAARLGSKGGATSAATVMAVRDLATDVVLDVNLRPPWYDLGAVIALARGGGYGGDDDGRKLALLKLNDEELPIMEEWCGLGSGGKPSSLSGEGLRERMGALAGAMNARKVCVTRGANGAALWCAGSRTGDEGEGERGAFEENEGFSRREESGCDTVGAGDAFLAAMVRSLLLDREGPEVALRRACALGAYVASCRGAVPDHGKAPQDLRDVFAYD